jgi:hypothetical protein
MKTICLTLTLGLAARARATECGELRLAVASLKAAAAADEQSKRAAPAREAREALRTAQTKLEKACAPRRVTVLALPLGYVPVAGGNASKVTVDPPNDWSLRITTQAGASSGIVFPDPLMLTLGETHWESEAAPPKSPDDLLLQVATDAQLTVEEPTAGKGAWHIELKNRAAIPLSQLRACAAGKGDAGAKLTKDVCAMLARVDLFARAGSIPDRGRAMLVGEWQYGWHAGFDLGDVELEREPPGPREPAARLELSLPLSGPLPGIAEDKRLPVAFEGNGQKTLSGATFKLAHECAPDDGVCESQRFDVEIWYDRVFGVPFLHTPSMPFYKGSAVGKVTDRLARAVGGQRVTLQGGDRKIITISDNYGEYRFLNLAGGEAQIFAVGRKPTNKPIEETRPVNVGYGESKVPVLYVNKLIE